MTDAPHAWPILMNLRTIADFLQLSPTSVRRLLAREQVLPVRLGLRVRRWRRSDLEALAERLGLGVHAPEAAAARDALAAVERRQGHLRRAASSAG